MKGGVLWDKVKGAWRSLSTEELEVAQEETPEWKPNRNARRAWWVRTRLKGAGYTRAMSKGRGQRDRERPARNRIRVLTPEERANLRDQVTFESRRRNMREERRLFDVP